MRSVSVRAVVGQAAALGRAPRVREVTFYPHLVSSFNCCYPANWRGLLEGGGNHIWFFRLSRKCDNGVNSGKTPSQKCENRLRKLGSETKLGRGLCCCRRRVRETICRDRLLLSSFNLPHAYFYGDWRAKVPNILQDERIYGQSGGDPAGWPSWAAAFYRNRQRSSNHVRKRFGYLCREGVAATSRGA
jgi:hypothetical protein